MRSIIYSRFGGPEQLQLADRPQPKPGKNEVLVKVHAASINSWDADLLKGQPFLVKLLGGFFKPRHPILGADIAGTIEAIGTGVTDFQPGDRVFGDIANAGFGGFAEYAVAPVNLIAKMPAGMEFEQAAALPQAGLLALQGLRFKKPLQGGQLLLINGAGGSVGTLALQYAKSLGAEVTCVDRREKFEMLQSLGADQLIDYREQEYTEMDRQYDYILDVIAHRSVEAYKRVLKPSGVFAMIGGSMGLLLARFLLVQPLLSRFSRKKLGIMGYRVNRNGLDEIASLFQQGILVPVIDRIFPLQETAEAFRYYLSGTFKGKIVISMA